jgi:hypothetical protein
MSNIFHIFYYIVSSFSPYWQLDSAAFEFVLKALSACMFTMF